MKMTRSIAPLLLAGLVATPVLAQPEIYWIKAQAQAQPQAQPQTSAPPTTSTYPPSTPPAAGASQPAGAMPPDAAAGTAPMESSAVSGAFKPIAPTPGANIVAELRSTGEFTILLKALDATNLTSVISTQPNITLLAPTDAAFNALPAAQLTTLMQPANAAQLQGLLTYHLINAKVSLEKVQNHAAGPVKTVSTKPVTIDGTGSVIKINDANVQQAGVPASNGLIYVVDKVLTPPA